MGGLGVVITNTYILTLHPATLPNSLMTSSNVVLPLVLSIYSHLQQWHFKFFLSLDSFYFLFLWLLQLGLPKHLDKRGENGYLRFVPDLRGNAVSFSLLTMMLAIPSHEKLCIAFIMFMYVSSMPTFWRIFIKWMFSFIKSFLCIYWDDPVVFILQFVNVVYHTDWFVDIEKNLCSPWIVPTSSWCTILLMYCWG